MIGCGQIPPNLRFHRSYVNVLHNSEQNDSNRVESLKILIRYFLVTFLRILVFIK